MFAILGHALLAGRRISRYRKVPVFQSQEGYPNVSGIGGHLLSKVKESVAALSSHPHDAIHVSRYDHGISSTRVPPAMADIDCVTL